MATAANNSFAACIKAVRGSTRQAHRQDNNSSAALVQTVSHTATAPNADPVDIIVPWVDGSDQKWLDERNTWLKKTGKQAKVSEVTDAADARYRDWDLLRYWFRGIDAFAPWVNTVHFVTWGHVPAWLDVSHPKLHIVKHTDYIPLKYLPTFNSNVIELNMHRIESLAERFVLFNDDMFLLKETCKEDFFKDGLPRGAAVLSPVSIMWGEFFLCSAMNYSLLNKYFSFHRCVCEHPLKWFNPRYGIGNILRTLCLLPWPRLIGFREFHTVNSYLKENFAKLWEIEPCYLDNMCQHRFREMTDLSNWFVEGWQFMKGEFYPRSPKISAMFRLRDADFDETLRQAASCIRNRTHRLVCVNDYSSLSWDNFERAKQGISAAFASILPDRCAFELATDTPARA